MQIVGLHKNIYKLANYACTQELLDTKTKNRQEILGRWELLKKHKVPDHEIAKITKISRATYYRRKKILALYGVAGLKARSTKPRTFRKTKVPESLVSLILHIRKENPTYGKSKIAVILTRDHGITYSESTVGRIITKLIKENKIQKSASYSQVKRRRKFTNHAQRWEYGMKAKQPGELVQIDHMTVTKNNISMKQFQAYDPITKFMVADVVSNATSTAAAKFLGKVIKDLPFPVKSLQVDGGSEFMKDFEEACKNLKIPLFVLPPKQPKYNGGVERGNRTFREEFYTREINAESIGGFRFELKKAVQKYNTYRPHFSLKGLTPMTYTNKILEASF